MVGRKFTVFSLYLRECFQVQAPGRLYYSEGPFNGGFFELRV